MSNMVFEDRISAYPNRYLVTEENGQTHYIVLERADEPVVAGTPLNAETLNAAMNGVTAASLTDKWYKLPVTANYGDHPITDVSDEEYSFLAMWNVLKDAENNATEFELRGFSLSTLLGFLRKYFYTESEVDAKVASSVGMCQEFSADVNARKYTRGNTISKLFTVTFYSQNIGNNHHHYVTTTIDADAIFPNSKTFAIPHVSSVTGALAIIRLSAEKTSNGTISFTLLDSVNTDTEVIPTDKEVKIAKICGYY